MKEIGRMVKNPLKDHVIIEKDWFSFFERDCRNNGWTPRPNGAEREREWPKTFYLLERRYYLSQIAERPASGADELLEVSKKFSTFSISDWSLDHFLLFAAKRVEPPDEDDFVAHLQPSPLAVYGRRGRTLPLPD